MPATTAQNSGFIKHHPRAAAAGLLVLAWAGVALASFLILKILYTIAAPAAPQLRTAAFWAAFWAAFVITALAAAPFIRFILVMWDTRYQEIRNRLNDSALAAYLVQFWETRFVDAAPGLKTDLDSYRRCGKLLNGRYGAEARALFKKIYDEQYGRMAFVTPVILVLTVITIETVLIVFTADGGIALLHRKFALPVFGAVAGTYMFVVGDCVMSARRRSLNISDVYWYALRLVLAGPIGLAVYQLGGDMMGAFALGTLPIDQFRKTFILYRNKNFTMPETLTAPDAPDQLICLDGVTGDISAQLGLEGITSTEQLIGTDPVSLAIRTGLPFKLILCLAGQAITRRHLRANAAALAGLGLAGAESVARLLQDLQARCTVSLSPAGGSPSTPIWVQNPDALTDPVIADALKAINAAAPSAPLGTPLSAQTLLTAFQRIADESFTRFLMANIENAGNCSVPGCSANNPLCDPTEKRSHTPASGAAVLAPPPADPAETAATTPSRQARSGIQR